jgi:hypothetical protein
MKNFIEIAADAAEELEEKSDGKPETEFIAWMRIALQREAMVTVMYQDKRVKAQLDAWAKEKKVPASVVDVILRALVAVWAQESGHQAYFQAMLKAIDPPKKFMERIDQMLLDIRGRVEGTVVAGLVSQDRIRRLSAQVAIIIGKTTTEVPKYVEALHKTNFSEYCSINADLEHTAVAGYDRMIALARQLPDADFVTDTPVLFDLIGTCKDETYHEELFRTLAGWPPDPPPAGTGPSHSPFAPATAPTETMTVADAREIIARAKTHSYGSDTQLLGDKVVEIDEQLIFHDPLIQHLRTFARQAVDEGNKQKFMTAEA